MTGEEVMVAMRTFIDSHQTTDHTTRYIQEKSEDGVGYHVGQTSALPYQRLSVFGIQPEEDLIEPDKTYGILAVDIYDPSGEATAWGYDFDLVLEYCFGFALELSIELMRTP